MKIQLQKNGIQPKQLIKLVGTGYFLGAGLLFGTLFLIGGIGTVLFGNSAEINALVPFIILVPVILVLQSIIFSLFIALGLWLFKKFKPLEIEIIE